MTDASNTTASHSMLFRRVIRFNKRFDESLYLDYRMSTGLRLYRLERDGIAFSEWVPASDMSLILDWFMEGYRTRDSNRPAPAPSAGRVIPLHRKTQK